MRLLLISATFGVALWSGQAYPHERHFDFGEVWSDAAGKHRRDEALSAYPRDVTRHLPRQFYEGRPHDPSGNIILEGAK